MCVCVFVTCYAIGKFLSFPMPTPQRKTEGESETCLWFYVIILQIRNRIQTKSHLDAIIQMQIDLNSIFIPYQMRILYMNMY